MSRRPLLPALAALLLAACSTPPHVDTTASIASVAPASGPYATAIEVRGAGFAPGSAVEVCGAPLEGLELDHADASVVAGPHVGGGAASASRASGTLAGVGPYGVCDVVVIAPDGERTTLEEAFEHVRAERDGKLLTRVLDASGAPVAGAAVGAWSVVAADAFLLRTSADPAAATGGTDCGVTDGGGYVRCDVPAGEWQVLASLGAARGAGRGVMGEGGGDAGDVVLRGAAGLGLTVRGEGGPAAGASVTFGAAFSATTGADGTASFEGLPAGAFPLRIALDGYLAHERVVTLEPGETAHLAIDLTSEQRAPEFASTPPEAATEDEPYRYDVEATDEDGDALAIAAPTLPAWLTLTDHGDGTATLSGTPAQAEVGTHDVTIRASDGVDAVEQGFTVTVAAVDDAPEILSFDARAAYAGIETRFAFEVRDEEGDPVSCVLDPGDGGGEIPLASCDEAIHAYAEPGAYTAVLTATAAGAETSAALPVEVEVLETRDFPQTCDDCLVEIPLDFAFPFYGAPYETAYVNSNGLITFAAASSGSSSYLYPSYGSYEDLPALPAIAVFWSDLRVSDVAQLRYAALPDRLVVVYDRVPHLYAPGPTYSAVAQLFADGRIEIAYGELGDVTVAEHYTEEAYMVGVWDGFHGSDTLLDDASASRYEYGAYGSGLILYEGAVYEGDAEPATLAAFEGRTIVYEPGAIEPRDPFEPTDPECDPAREEVCDLR